MKMISQHNSSVLRFILALLLSIISNELIAQQSDAKRGELPMYPNDSTFIFTSPRPLLNDTTSVSSFRSQSSIGLDILFSGSGYGFGMFFQKSISKDLVAVVNTFFTGVRNTSELEVFDYYTGQWIVPGKSSRLSMVPLMFGVNYKIFQSNLGENFRPFISGGFGPVFIFQNPYVTQEGYVIDYFSSWKDSKTYIKYGGYIGLGATISVAQKSNFQVNLRYYTIPYGEEGLESIQGNPIANFGGPFITISIGGIK
jgi:hypothetical protein